MFGARRIRDLERGIRRQVLVAALTLAAAGVLASMATAARDPLTGVWVAHDLAGDQSTDRYVFSGPDGEGVRAYKLVDSYGSFCETDGPGTGAVLTAKGTATLTGSTVTILTSSFVCANGRRGTFDPPLRFEAALTGDGLDFHYYVAERVGE